MKERPILFSGPMVRAIIEGRKTQTRRVLKGSTEHKGPYNPAYIEAHKDHVGWAQICPYGQPGDRLWVRETWQVWTELNHVAPRDLAEACGNVAYPDINYPACGNVWDAKLRPSIHMPRWASRITLEITGVRVERLQDISEEDAVNEGIGNHEPECVQPTEADGYPSCQCGDISYIESFQHLWESINGPDSWNENPWVWVVEFKRLEQQEVAA